MMNVTVDQTKSDYGWAYLLLRLAIGLDLLIHGAIRLFGNFEGFRTWLTGFFANSPMPEIFVTLGAWTIPPVELVLGLLILFGIRTKLSVFAASLVMLGLLAGTCVVQKWEIVGLQLNYLLLYCVLIAFNRFDICGFDRGLKLN